MMTTQWGHVLLENIGLESATRVRIDHIAVSHRLPTANREPPTYWWYADAFGKGL
jgi:hypothetical protein